jgi:hypothetical protein
MVVDGYQSDAIQSAPIVWVQSSKITTLSKPDADEAGLPVKMNQGF